MEWPISLTAPNNNNDQCSWLSNIHTLAYIFLQMSWRTYSILKILDCIRMVQTTDPIFRSIKQNKNLIQLIIPGRLKTHLEYGYKGWEWDYEGKVQPVTRIISPGADTGFKWGGGLDFLGTKKFIIRNKKSRSRRKYFWLNRLKKSQN